MNKKLLILVPLITISVLIGVFFYTRHDQVPTDPQQFATQFLMELKDGDKKSSFNKLSKEIQSFHGSEENFNKAFIEPLQKEDDLNKCESTAVLKSSTFAYVCPRQGSDNRDIILITVTKEDGTLKITELSRDGFKRFQASQQSS